MPKGNRRDAARPSDQPDWDGCIAWRRMLIALMNAALDVDRALEPFLVDVTLKVNERPVEHRHKPLDMLHASRTFLLQHRYYDACACALEALAHAHEITGPDRLEIVGRTLCVYVRAIYPLAPAGFERVGRMRGGFERPPSSDQAPG